MNTFELLVKLLVFLLAIHVSSCREKDDFQWYLDEYPGANVRKAWSISQGSENVKIAVIDAGIYGHSLTLKSGMESTPPRVKIYKMGNTVFKKNDWHGTSVASIIGADGNNEQSFQGIAPKSELLALEWGDTNVSLKLFVDRAMTGQKECLDKGQACSGDRGKKADIINASLGALAISIDEALILNQWYLDIAAYINSGDGILVTSGGNNGQNADFSFPSGQAGVISVGATDHQGKRAPFSNWGNSIEIMAPGTEIHVDAFDKISVKDGTSFASPIVAGTIALMKEVFSPKENFSWRVAEYILAKTSMPITCDDYCLDNDRCRAHCCHNDSDRQTCTPGIINAFEALKLARMGMPHLPMLDADKYYLSVSGDVLETEKLCLRNVGGAEGTVVLLEQSEKIATWQMVDSETNDPVREILLGPTNSNNSSACIKVQQTKSSMHQSLVFAVKENTINKSLKISLTLP